MIEAFFDAMGTLAAHLPGKAGWIASAVFVAVCGLAVAALLILAR